MEPVLRVLFGAVAFLLVTAFLALSPVVRLLLLVAMGFMVLAAFGAAADANEAAEWITLGIYALIFGILRWSRGGLRRAEARLLNA